MSSNREAISAAVLKYMKGLPEPNSLPKEIALEIVFEEATERHRFEFKAEERSRRVNTKDLSEVLQTYHEHCKALPKVRALTKKREQSIALRLEKYGMDGFRELFKKASESDFLCGKNDRRWVANFDWLLNENNMLKVLEGDYDNRSKKSGEKPQSFDVDAGFAKALSRSYGG